MKHKFVKKVTEKIIKLIAFYLLRNNYKKADNEQAFYNRPKVVYQPEGIDFYSYCHDKNCKKHCHGGTMFYALYFRDLRLVAHTEYGLYLEVIRKFIIEPYIYPFC